VSSEYRWIPADAPAAEYSPEGKSREAGKREPSLTGNQKPNCEVASLSAFKPAYRFYD
jgi:hypothetical protein